MIPRCFPSEQRRRMIKPLVGCALTLRGQSSGTVCKTNRSATYRQTIWSRWLYRPPQPSGCSASAAWTLPWPTSRSSCRKPQSCHKTKNSKVNERNAVHLWFNVKLRYNRTGVAKPASRQNRTARDEIRILGSRKTRKKQNWLVFAPHTLKIIEQALMSGGDLVSFDLNFKTCSSTDETSQLFEWAPSGCYVVVTARCLTSLASAVVVISCRNIANNVCCHWVKLCILSSMFRSRLYLSLFTLRA